MNTYVRTYGGPFDMVKRRQARTFDSDGLELGPDGRRYNRIRGAPYVIQVQCAAMRGPDGRFRCGRGVWWERKNDFLCWSHHHFGCPFGRFDDEQ